MFDVSFFELLVIGVVALVVIGPERLPEAIKTCALWIGRMKRILAESRTEFEKHIGADEIRRELHNEQIMASLEKLQASRAVLEQDLLNYQNTIQAELHALEHGAESHLENQSNDDGAAGIPAKAIIETAESERIEPNVSEADIAQPTSLGKIDPSDTASTAQDTTHQTKSAHD